MPKEVTYIESFELLELATKLLSVYFVYIGHVDLEMIYFAEKSGEKPKKAKVGDISGLTSNWAKLLLAKSGKNNKLYCMSVWGTEWAELSPAQREWVVFSLLTAVSPFNDGKLVKPDISDRGYILEYFMNEGVGPYWEKSENLPSLLDGDPLPIPLPPDPEEDEAAGSTMGD